MKECAMADYAYGLLKISGILIAVILHATIVIGIIRFIEKKTAAAPQMKVKDAAVPQRKKITASTVLLLIGTAFIVCASIAFVAANWNDMEPAGKVFALLGASVAAFGISAVLNGAFRLKKTSVSFYAMGTLIAAVSFVTAGYYKLFGGWFSLDGKGELLLLGVAAVIVSAVSFVGYVFYRNAAMHYIGFSFAALAVLMICGQCSDYDYPLFSVIIAGVQLVITAAVEFFGLGREKIWGKPLKTVARVSAVVYVCLALLNVAFCFTSADANVYAVMVILLAQLVFYGFYKKSALLRTMADFAAFYTVLAVSVSLESAYGTAAAEIAFSFMTLLIYVLNRTVPGFGGSERVTALSGAVLGSLAALGASAPVFLRIAAPVLVSAAILEFAFSSSIIIQNIAGIASPFMPFLITLTISDSIRMNVGYDNPVVMPLSFCGYAAICMAAAAAVLFIRKISFSFHAKHPLKTQALVYSNLAASGFALLSISGCTEISVVILVLCAVHFALSCLPGVNFTAGFSSAAVLVAVNKIVGELVPNGYVDLENGIHMAILAVVLVASRFVFPESIIRIGKDKKITADVFLFTAWLCVFSMAFSGEYRIFFVRLSMAFYAAAFIKKNTGYDARSCILTGSAGLAVMALLQRPFLVSGSDAVTSKINLLIFVLLGIAGKFIWRENKLVSKLLSTTIFVSCFASLIIDGIVNGGVLNRIFVLCVTALVLVLSFFWKSKTWFTASSVSLVVLTGFFMHEYISSAGWWVYLLAVGIVLVTVAAVNEACRKKGENVFTTVERKFSDWNW